MSARTTSDELDTLRAGFERERLAAFDPLFLLALAVFPEWTKTLAEEVWFGAGDDAESLDSLLGRLASAGLIERRELLTEDGDVRIAFWLPASKRADVGHYLQQLWNLDETLTRIRALARAFPTESDLHTEEIRHWVFVVDRHLHLTSGADLLNNVEFLVENNRTTEALSLVGAAQALGDVIGEPLLSAARRAQWRIDRGYRQAMDASTLEHYLPRPDVERALVELIAGTGDRWALHLLGDGGVGKTMTVRDLASGRFAARQHLDPFPVARIDFDHLDPRYPERRPAELLLALGTELTGYAGTRAAYHANRYILDSSAAVHEWLADAERSVAEPGLLDSAIESFAEFLDELGGTVILVLDTCEELAKLYGPGGRAPAIDHTFEVLERIRDRTPRMRVLLAGRRWLIPPPEPSSSAGLTLAPRPYLDIVRVGGFTRQQARDYLDRRDQDRVLSGHLRTAVLDRSARTGSGEINPFDLAGYCTWALDEPDLDARRLLGATGDPYVQQRIIDRVSGPEVRDCLPVAVELGRFDRAMIEPYLTRRTIDPERAFSGLISQEWVSTVTFGADGRPRVIEVDDQLLPRLRAAITANPVRFPLDRVRLGQDLATLVRTSPFEELTIESVEGALRLLPVHEAGAMWATLEERITQTDAWWWANQAVPRAAAVETERAFSDGTTIMAAILATQAAAALRQPGTPGLARLWREAGTLAGRHPDVELASALSYRAMCGRFVSASSEQPLSIDDDVTRWAQLPAGAAVGSMTAVIDTFVIRDPQLLAPVRDAVESLCHNSAPEITATALLTRAAYRLASRDHDGAARDAELAEEAAKSTSDTRWTDWIAPHRLLDRARLARLAIAAVRGQRPMEFPLDRWRADALDHLADIDAERLVAATIAVELGWGLVDRAVLTKIMDRETYVRERQPTHHWHHHTTTLFAVVALAVAASGQGERAVRMLDQRQEEAVGAGEDPATVTECDAALVAVCRMFRSTPLTSAAHRVAREGAPWLREQAWATLTLCEGECPRDPEAAGSWSAWWRAQVRQPGRSTYTGEHRPPARQRSGHDPVADIDRVEFNRTAQGSLSRTGRDYLVHALRALGGAGFTSRSEQTVRLGAMLRAQAMLGWDQNAAAALAAGNPSRRVAEIALAEGELLALRLPEEATHLLRFASLMFAECGDSEAAYRSSVLCVLAHGRAGGDPRSMRLPRNGPDWESRADVDWAARRELAKRLIRGERVTAPVGPSPECAPRPADLQPADVTTSAGSNIIGAGTLVGQAASVSTAFLRPSIQDSIGFNVDHRSLAWSDCRVESDDDLLVIKKSTGTDIPTNGRWPLLDRLPNELFRSAQPYLVVPLVVPDDSLDEPWEQTLAANRSHMADKMLLWVRFQERKRYGGTTSWGFEPVVGRGGKTRFAGPRNLSAASRPADNMVHLVGNPVRTSAGWRMRVEDSTSPRLSSHIDGNYEPTGYHTYTGERLFGPDDLPASPTGLVVLQATPLDGWPRQLGRMRKGMCHLAHSFRKRGVAVLVIPPLPDKLAEHVVALPGYQPIRRPIDVLDLHYTIRNEVERHERETKPGTERASLDVLLFV